MARSILIPRINNNDDEVRLVALSVSVGERIARGQIIAEIETDKSVMEVEADSDGFVIQITVEIDAMATVGSPLFWIGDSADEPVPVADQQTAQRAIPESTAEEPTGKALLLLRQYGLDQAVVPRQGTRLRAEDIERYMASRAAPQIATPTVRHEAAPPAVEGVLQDMRLDERAMLGTVTWHRDEAVAGYIEVDFDPTAWEQYSKEFSAEHKLLFSPHLSLMAHRLIALARETPKLNSTVVGAKRYEYSVANLGFTIQVGDRLYLAVVRDAHSMDPITFVNALGEIQRRAAAHKLRANETQGATLGFSSMARWKVSRHMPVLAPHTSLMVAHTSTSPTHATLGATYDHRVLNGSHVVAALRKLTRPA